MSTKPPYQQSPEDLYAAYTSNREGLTSQQAKQNQERYGKNKLAEKKKKPIWLVFLEQFKDFLVIILIIAAIVSAITGELESTIVILFVITMNAILGTVQTVKAEKSLDNLKSLSAPHAKVLRDGTTVLLPAEELVVGDVILLEAGDQVPADARVLESASLQTNESALTGESLNVEKEADCIDQEVPLGDRKNMVYSGGFVTYGRGVCLVTSVGMETEVGKIAALMQNASERKTPLQRTLDQFGKRLSIAILIICAIVFGLELLRVDVLNFDSIMGALMFAIALAVAAIPEALSSIVTIVLSFGTQKMAKEHAIIRKLQAVEGLGSVSVICSDKTGTLTQNKMKVRKIVSNGHSIAENDVNIENEAEKWLIIASVLCSDATCKDDTEIGDPTETALVRFSQKNGMQEDDLRQQYPRLAEIPFDSDRKLMSTLNQT
ncbi:MAG: cation-translocating P-type ATPase, partial [Ruminococcus sp.]